MPLSFWPRRGGGGTSGGTGEPNPTAATRGEAEAGTVTALRSWSPLRVAQAIAALAGDAASVAWSAVTGKPNFADVATSGSYGDLSGAPTDAEIGDKAFSNPPSDLSAGEKSAVRSAIDAITRSELDDSLIERLYGDTVAANAAIFTVDGATVENDANQAYYIRVAAVSEFTLGSALFAATSSSAVTVDGVRFWTVGNALRIGPTSSAKAVTVWKVDDLAAIRSTVQQAITQAATWARDGNTDDIPVGKMPPEVALESEVADSVIALSFLNRVLTGMRRSGTNPIEINLSALASDAGVPLGSLRSLGFWHPAADVGNSQFIRTGIMLPAAPDDEAVFLTTARWGTSNDYPPTNGSLTGAAIKALPIVAAGANAGGTDILHDGVGDTTLSAGKLATGELLLRNDEGEWVAAGDYFAMYEVLDAAAAGRIVNPDTTIISTVNAGGRYASVEQINPASPITSGRATPATIGLLAAGASLPEYASDLNETEDSVTLEPGTYIASVLMAVYSATTGGTLEGSNQRYNTYHDAVMDIAGAETVISHQLTESYVRPIGGALTTEDVNFGGFVGSFIMRVRQKGAVKFRHALTGQSAFGHLGTRQICLYRLTGPEVPTVATPPSISSFQLVGDLSPAAGAINESYTARWAVAQSSHLSALRIVRFTGTDAAPAAVTVLATIPTANWHGGQQSIRLSGFSLAANETETVRIEGYGAGQTPGTDQPITYHDVRITPHAPATAAVRFIRVPRTFGSPAARPTAATLVAALAETGAGVISTGSTPIGDWNVSGIPDTGQWLIGWIVAQSVAQPNHFTQAGIQIDVAVAARFAFSQNGVDYYVYLFADTNYVDSTYNGSTLTVS